MELHRGGINLGCSSLLFYFISLGISVVRIVKKKKLMALRIFSMND